ncbi:ABC transporter ATP-binding protein [Hypericibacter adhaerens]|jgi:ABC-type branched-subunit amino acid transport system ATPase component|uniref:ABC transporter ATP-binding protein n=1 Tax=Hypericibacter adhaerens TaxID=2602016 RepID=A0A5J6MRQ3_9PROT|nr:ABC transporter ATP-binding protein [Hypericibacter adhaerens]QEX20208.1 ABC transporter ATP-binding protein [Hypericibacter adhaerens]
MTAKGLAAAQQASTAAAKDLVVEALAAGYTGVEIVRGVSMSVQPGELVTIIGPNGSGKSTLLKSIFGLVSIYAGSIRFGGTDITGNPPEKNVRLGLGFTPQTDNVFPSLTIEENLRMGGYSVAGDLQEHFEFIYSLFPALADRRRLPAGNLSGGQRQMLAMGRSLMTSPSLLLLDEPSAGLSPKFVDVVFEHILSIRDRGTSILLVEQNAYIALSVCDRAYVLATGEKQLEGPGKQLRDDPEIRRLYLGGG